MYAHDDAPLQGATATSNEAITSITIWFARLPRDDCGVGIAHHGVAAISTT